jgi:putative transposase
MIGNVPPVEYEQTYYRHQTAREDPISGEPSLH